MRLNLIIFLSLIKSFFFSQNYSAGLHTGTLLNSSAIFGAVGLNTEYSYSIFNGELRSNVFFQSTGNYNNRRQFYEIFPALGLTTFKKNKISFSVKIGACFYFFKPNYEYTVIYYNQIQPSLMACLDVNPFKKKRLIIKFSVEMNTIQSHSFKQIYNTTAMNCTIGLNYSFIRKKKKEEEIGK